MDHGRTFSGTDQISREQHAVQIGNQEKEQIDLVGSAKRHQFAQQERAVAKLAEEAEARRAAAPEQAVRNVF